MLPETEALPEKSVATRIAEGLFFLLTLGEVKTGNFDEGELTAWLEDQSLVSHDAIAMMERLGWTRVVWGLKRDRFVIWTDESNC